MHKKHKRSTASVRQHAISQSSQSESLSVSFSPLQTLLAVVNLAELRGCASLRLLWTNTTSLTCINHKCIG